MENKPESLIMHSLYKLEGISKNKGYRIKYFLYSIHEVISAEYV